MYTLDNCITQSQYSIRSMLRGHQTNHIRKRQKLEHGVPVITGLLQKSSNPSLGKKIIILLDSGASQSIIDSNIIEKNAKKIEGKSITWKTISGNFSTKFKTAVKFKLPSLHESRTIETEMHIAPHISNYDMIIGRDLLHELGLMLNFSEQTVIWDHAVAPMKYSTNKNTQAVVTLNSESKPVLEATDRMKKILEAKYEAADLNTVVSECKQLSSREQQQLLAVLKNYSSLFDGTLGHWKREQYEIKLRPDAKPYHARPYPVPKAYETTLKMEVERLCKIGVLKRINRSEWASPTFIIPKKDKTVRFISDFRELNKRIKRQPFPLPKIQDLLLKLEGFQYATSLDLNMGYYHIELSPFSKQLCTIVLPWGKYEYQRLPMGLCNSPDIFQEKMSILMADLEYVRAYIDDLLILTKGSFLDHLKKLATVLHRLKQANLKINAKKSFFAQEQLEYLGYWITRKGIQPIQTKITAIQQIAAPKTKKELRRFIGMVNYYRDMWVRRSEVLAPLAALTSKTTKWFWTKDHQDAFDLMKKIVSRETLLAYPDFSQPFDIYTDASHSQLGAAICQDNKPIAFYSRKLNPAQTRYTTMERELLAIVETLKEFRNILLGHEIRIHTDHKNLTYKNFNTERVMRWRLIIEEFGPTFHYVKGESNVVADALSRLEMLPSPAASPTDVTPVALMAELYGADNDDVIFPLTFDNIMNQQKKDNVLQKQVADSSQYHFKSFRGGGKAINLICRNDKIVVPSNLQKELVSWYHTQLCHPGETRTEQTIRQHFWFSNLRDTVHDMCSKCPTCQKSKVTFKKYGKLPAKEAETEPWERLCVDLIGPYTIKRKGKDSLRLWCITMIDPATGWLEIRELKDKEATTTANIVEQTWLTRYPIPQILNYDRGTEFMAEFAEMIENDYGIKRKGSTVRNPQSNAILERVHQTIGNMIRTFNKDDLDETDPWAGILAATMFAVRATYHTTMQATPTQLVFGRDAILNTKFEANWAFIKERKQKLIDINNKRENASRILHTYQVNDKVLYKNVMDSKFSEDPWKGPYLITQVNDNGTVRVQMGKVTDTVNIRNIKPFKE